MIRCVGLWFSGHVRLSRRLGIVDVLLHSRSLRTSCLTTAIHKRSEDRVVPEMSGEAQRKEVRASLTSKIATRLGPWLWRQNRWREGYGFEAMAFPDQSRRTLTRSSSVNESFQRGSSPTLKVATCISR
jgi:hypothetical protein